MTPPSWVEVIYVIPLYGVSQGLNLNLSSVGGRSLKLTDYYRAEARRYLPERAKTEARPCEAEARPSQLKKTASRPPRAEPDASRTTSLGMADVEQTIVEKAINQWGSDSRPLSRLKESTLTHAVTCDAVHCLNRHAHSFDRPMFRSISAVGYHLLLR